MAYRQEYVYWFINGATTAPSLLEWSEKLSADDKIKYDKANENQMTLIKNQIANGNLIEDFELVQYFDLGYESAYNRIWISKEVCDAFTDDTSWLEFHERYSQETNQKLEIKIRIV